jgi:polyisoprenoid-binding protein YceI
MALAAGTYRFGPENATLSVRTGRTGAAAKAGHDLLLHVTAWQATLEVGDGSAGSSLVLEADATSMRVQEGTGGMQALDDDDKANIEQTIDDEVLMGQAIGFRSTSVVVAGDDGRLEVSGDLTLSGTTHPIAFDVAVDADGMLRGTIVVEQSDWGMKPYSALFGTLKVADEVEVTIDASTRSADPRSVTGDPERPRSVARRRRLRAPALDPAVSSFLWALFFFGYLVLGMAAVGVSLAVALVLALVAAVAIFVFVRRRGGEPEGAGQSR